MSNTNETWDKTFLVIGVFTIFSGIYLFTNGNYVLGVSGTTLGTTLTIVNYKKTFGRNIQ